MRFNHRSPTHWFAFALVLGLGLFTVNHARGQSANAAAVFEGRPALAGAQGGLGAQAGMPQGGIGVQGNEAAKRQLNLRKPSGLDSAPALTGSTTMRAGNAVAARSDVTLVPRKGEVARDTRTPAQRTKKAVKRTFQRSRTGVGEIAARTTTASIAPPISSAAGRRSRPRAQTIEVDGDKAFVTCCCATGNGKSFRNSEYITSTASASPASTSTWAPNTRTA